MYTSKFNNFLVYSGPLFSLLNLHKDQDTLIEQSLQYSSTFSIEIEYTVEPLLSEQSSTFYGPYHRNIHN